MTRQRLQLTTHEVSIPQTFLESRAGSKERLPSASGVTGPVPRRRRPVSTVGDAVAGASTQVRSPVTRVQSQVWPPLVEHPAWIRGAEVWQVSVPVAR